MRYRRRVVTALVFGVCLTACGALSSDETLGEVQGANVDALAAFELEDETPVAAERPSELTELGRYQILHPDPLDLVGHEFEVASSPAGIGLTTAITRAFRDDGYRGIVPVSLMTDDDAIMQVCDGETYAAVTSRPLSDAEADRCSGLGLRIEQLPVALDRLIVVAHPDNFWIGNVPWNSLLAVLEGQSWSDVEPTWPQRPMRKFLPPLGSIEMDLIIDAARVEGIDEANDIPGAVFEADADERLRRLANDPSAISLVPIASVRRTNVDFVERSLSLIEPLRSTTYPAERAVYFTVSLEALEADPDFATFVAYFLNRTDLEASSHYLARHADLQSARERFVRVAASLGLKDGLAPLLTIDRHGT